MKMRPESLAVTQLEPYWFEDALPKATAFIYRFGNLYGLVTNWHVLAGKHPVTEISFNKDHKTPRTVRFHISVHRMNGQVEFVSAELPLERDGQRLWLEHPGYPTENGTMERVDLAVLPLNDLLSGLGIDGESVFHLGATMIVRMKENGEPDFVEPGYARVGSEVFILGFPLGLAFQGVVPVWKRGSIASEPLFNVEGNVPIFFIDSTTRDGMSGSPIVYFGNEVTNEFGEPAFLDLGNLGPWLLGVYAGRRGSADSETEMLLGRGWRGTLLNEIFMQAHNGPAESTSEREEPAPSGMGE